MYLGKNHVRVVYERVWRIIQDWAKKQGLAARSRGWLAARSRGWLAACKPPECYTHAKHARSWRVMPTVWRVTTGQKSQTGQAICSRLELATQPSREVKSPEHPVWEKLTFHIPSHPTIYIPLYPRFWESFQKEFWERNPREKQDWLIHNLHIETLQIPLLSSSPLLNPWDAHYQNLYSPYPYLWEGYLVLWEAVKKGPISYW